MKIAAVVVFAGLVEIASAFSIRRPGYYEQGQSGLYSTAAMFNIIFLYLQNLLMKCMTPQ